MGESILKVKSYSFALMIIKVCRGIIDHKKEYDLGRQLLRSGTSIGALIRESEYAQSKADFISKMNIALNEANETEYWISLLRDSDIISPETYTDLFKANQELLKMLISTIKTSKINSNKPLTNK
jgi:four helix bundle protein